MRSSKAQILSKVHTLPKICFDDQKLTSFARLVVFQPLLKCLNLKWRLNECFPHRRGSPAYGMNTIMMVLIIRVTIGFRRLRDVEYYSDDPMVQRTVGLRRLQGAPTLSRALRSAGSAEDERVRMLSREMVQDRLGLLVPLRLTLDFEGMVCSMRALSA
ncbi:MAG: transposase [bacterium]